MAYSYQNYRNSPKAISSSDEDEVIEDSYVKLTPKRSGHASRRSKVFSNSNDTVVISESSDDSDTSGNIIRVKSKGINRISDSDESEYEERALSPNTRFSITGIKPKDLSDSDETLEENCIFSESEDELHSFDAEGSGGHNSKSSNSTKEALLDNSESSQVDKGNIAENKDFNVSITEKLSSTKCTDLVAVNLSDLQICETEKDSSLELLTKDNESSLIEVNSSCDGGHSAISDDFISKDLDSQKEIVSQEFYNNEKYKLQELKLALESSESLLNSVKSKLPDKGERLILRNIQLKEDIKKQESYLAKLIILKETSDNSSSKPKSELPTWDEISANVNAIQPKYTGKIGLNNFNTQKALTIETLKDIHGCLESCPTKDIAADDPDGLKVTLMKHQRHALAWMCWRENQKPRGGILADDMGLGKTLSMISLILKSIQDIKSNKNSNTEDRSSEEDSGWSAKGRRTICNGGTLVVCPASLLQQWQGEIKNRVSPNLISVLVHHGSNRSTTARQIVKYDVVITTYNLVAREFKTETALFSVNWKRVILDEGHIVRNHKTNISIGVCNLRSKCRWILTGTPIQNKETDLYALIKFLRCSPFDELSYWKKWIDNKSAGGQQRLQTLMKSLMLRRTKSQLQDEGDLMSLPPKKSELIFVTLDKDEMNVYQKIMVYSKTLFTQFLYQRAERKNDLQYLEEGYKRPYSRKADPNNAYHQMHQNVVKLMNSNKEVKTHEILVLLLRLRQICCHPGLIDAMLCDESDLSNISDTETSNSDFDLLEQFRRIEINENPENASVHLNLSEGNAISKGSSKLLLRTQPVFDMERPSSKIKAVLEIIEQKILNTNDKAVVVSQWTSVLEILKIHLSKKKIACASLTGNIPVKLRGDVIKDFNTQKYGPKILLLSLCAGGVGLNLAAANHLLLIDLHWNPQLEAQAQDRIYRVGQQKDVTIYKFVCKDTIEERIKGLQDQKLSLASQVLTGSKASESSKLSIDDLKNLFGL